MKNQFLKKYKRILPVVIVAIVTIICIVCVKEKDRQKKMESTIEDTGINDYLNNGKQPSNSLLSDFGEALNEQPNDFVKDDMETVNADGESTENDVETSETDEEGEEDKWNVDFEVIRAEYIYDEQRNEIEIYYPQLCGLEDSAKEVRINALIEEDVMQIIGEKNKEGDHTLYCVGLDYKIKFLNERIISVLYEGWEGYVMRGHSALDDEAITVTIDIEEEKVITLQDVVTDFTELSDMLLADKFEHITMWEGKAGGYQVSMEYKECEDKLENDLREKYQEWYTDGKNFVIIIEKRADYNEYAISNESVEHILDAGFLRKLE